MTKLEVQLKFQLEPTLLQRSCGCRWVFQVVPESSEEESFLGRIQNYRLFTDQLFSLYRSTKVRMKIKTALDLLTALRARARRFSKKKMETTFVYRLAAFYILSILLGILKQ